MKGFFKSLRTPLAYDPKNGIEKELRKRNIMEVFISLFAGRFLNSIFSIGLNRHFVRHEELKENPVKSLKWLILGDVQFETLLQGRGPLVKGHLCAGNRVRLENDLVIRKG